MQQYKYNGKELDRMHGLNTYDYGARQHDPILGRWDRIDPLCEKYYGVSPYNYCHNNPTNRIDIDGRDDYFSNTGKFLYSKGEGSNIYIQQGKSFCNFNSFDLRNHSNLQMAANIVGYYAKAVGVKYNMNGGQGTVGVKTLCDAPKGKRVLGFTINGNIYIKITNGKFDRTMYNIYQLRGTLRHEKGHKEDQEKGVDKSSNLRHAQIIMEEMENEDFEKCTEEYKIGQIDQFRGYYREARKEISSMDQSSTDAMKLLRTKLNEIEEKNK